MTIQIQIKKLKSAINLDLPNYSTIGSAGMDLYAAIELPYNLKAGAISIIPTGISISLPQDLEAQIRPRSGLAAKFGITVLNSPGTIDSDYRGEIKVILINHSKENFLVEPGMRIAQIIIAKYEQISWAEVDELNSSVRGTGGLGSTGHF